MNKEPKYYTPTIEEFCVGFEYETNRCSTLPESDQVWEKAICHPVSIPLIDYDLNCTNKEALARNKSIRVKVLDREDIEGEGFVVSDDIVKDAPIFRKTVPCGPYGLDEKIVRVSTVLHQQHVWIQYSYPAIGDKFETQFQGTIRNATEFRKLLKQLGI